MLFFLISLNKKQNNADNTIVMQMKNKISNNLSPILILSTRLFRSIHNTKTEHKKIIILCFLEIVILQPLPHHRYTLTVSYILYYLFFKTVTILFIVIITPSSLIEESTTFIFSIIFLTRDGSAKIFSKYALLKANGFSVENITS